MLYKGQEDDPFSTKEQRLFGNRITIPPMVPRVLEVLERRLTDMQSQLSHAKAWDIVQRVQENLGSDGSGVHPLVLEAEIDHVVNQHVGGQELDGKETTGDDAPPSDSVQVALRKPKKRSRNKDAQGGPSVQESVDAKDEDGAGSLRMTKKRIGSFKASIQARAGRVKPFRNAGMARIEEARRESGVFPGLAKRTGKASSVTMFFNKIQERGAMSSIRTRPSAWLSETEKSLKDRKSYKCHKLPPLKLKQPRDPPTPPPLPEEVTTYREAGRTDAVGAVKSLFSRWKPERGREETPSQPPAQAPPDANSTSAQAVCQKHVVHVAITINKVFQQGAMALIHSILWNAACPGRVFFHICHLADYALDVVLAFFPYLNYKAYVVDGSEFRHIVRSMAYRGHDLENPLNYVRMTLPHIIPECVEKLIYLDTDTLMLGRVEDMYSTDVSSNIIGSPEFCDYKLQNYFTKEFWANRTLSRRFESKKRACYFNPGVLVINAPAWRKHSATKRLQHWLELQKRSKVPLYTLGSLPPFLLVFAGEVAHMALAWNEHDLGSGCNIVPVPHKARLLHWSCSGKPWRRIRDGAPCSIDTYYWQPYDLMGKVQPRAWCDDGELPKKIEELPDVATPGGQDEEQAARPATSGSPIYFEQLFHKPKRRQCAQAVHIPGLSP